MELVEGEDLSALIARGAIPLAEVLTIARPRPSRGTPLVRAVLRWLRVAPDATAGLRFRSV
jgi:hypothetical protein